MWVRPKIDPALAADVYGARALRLINLARWDVLAVSQQAFARLPRATDGGAQVPLAPVQAWLVVAATRDFNPARTDERHAGGAANDLVALVASEAAAHAVLDAILAAMVEGRAALDLTAEPAASAAVPGASAPAASAAGVSPRGLAAGAPATAGSVHAPGRD